MRKVRSLIHGIDKLVAVRVKFTQLGGGLLLSGLLLGEIDLVLLEVCEVVCDVPQGPEGVDATMRFLRKEQKKKRGGNRDNTKTRMRRRTGSRKQASSPPLP
jgi:hypothetical protein